MALKYTVKNFEDVDTNKLVGLLVEDDNGKKFAIDKQIALVDGKSDASYVQDAVSAASSEISAWQNQESVVGKVFNVDDNTLNDE